MEKKAKQCNYMIQCRFSEFLIQIVYKKTIWGVYAEILLPGNNAFRESCAWPILGFVQQYKILEKYTPLVCSKKHLILVQKTGYGFGGTPLPPFTDKIRKVVFDGLFRQKGGYGFRGYPCPPFTDKIRKVVFDGFPYDNLIIKKVV